MMLTITTIQKIIATKSWNQELYMESISNKVVNIDTLINLVIVNR